MRTPLVVANWKMHGSLAENQQWCQDCGEPPSSVDAIVCPPHIYLAQMRDLLLHNNSQVALGAQDVNEHLQGALTGEVSAQMLADFDCHYSIVGHSERRASFGDSSQRIKDKIIALARHNITPILCVGENRAQRDQGQTETLIEEQLRSALDDTSPDCVVAYEPIWAIGTGNSASPEQAEGACAFIREIVGQILGPRGQEMRVLYGGSINKDNVESLFGMPSIDGGLVGGASLSGTTFRLLCDVAAA